jgi:hypothetical protein
LSSSVQLRNPGDFPTSGMTIKDGAIAVRDEECRSSSDRALDGILIRGAIAVRDEECRSSSDGALDGILIRCAIEPKAHRAKRDRARLIFLS